MKSYLSIIAILMVLSGCSEKSSQSSIGLEPGDTMVDSIGMEFVWVPAGKFNMGSDTGAEIEKPVHEVVITKGFWIGKYEVTQEQYQKIMGKDPARSRLDHPADNVRRDDVLEFCKKLSDKEDVAYTLPTEAQWEYACRAGSDAKYCFGDSEDELGDYAWYDDNVVPTDLPPDSEGHARFIILTCPVGQKKPNKWGIHDMHGNVAEWTLDTFARDYENSSNIDPVGPKYYSGYVVRGGNIYLGPEISTATIRRMDLNSYYGTDLGFRVVRLID
ncbi:MAG: formylglycine-generating enzyme family protein [Phycisphaerae bacterium]|nr:formylglycine-generating enzyme family protein [Phycisphaerae bacterium]